MKNVVVFDLETTGCNPVLDSIIEIGAIKIENGKAVDKYHQMLNPKESIPSFITEITGITNDMVKDGLTIEEALPSFLDFCDGDYVLGHNVSFDYRFIKAKSIKEGYGFSKKAIDTLAIARRFLKHLPSRSLAPLCQYYGIDLTNAHRAIHDAEATFQLFKCLKRDFFHIDESLFKARDMVWNPPKQDMITERQKRYLISLIKTHKIEIDKDIEGLTKSEASRMIDNILTQYRCRFI